MPRAMYPALLALCALLLLLALEFLLHALQILPPLLRENFWLLLIRFNIVVVLLVLAFQCVYLVGSRAERANGRICPWCDCDLTSQPPRGSCPECGREYERHDLHKYWNAWWNIADRQSVRSEEPSSPTPVHASPGGISNVVLPVFAPAVYKRPILILGVILIIQAASFALALSDALSSIFQSAAYETIIATISVCTLAASIVWVLMREGHVRRLDGLLCPWCNYDLCASPPEGKCPECGKPYTLEHLKNYWFTSPITRCWKRLKK